MKRNFYFTDLPKITIGRVLNSILFLIVLFLGTNLSAQTISGTVKDKATGEALIGASVIDNQTGNGTITDLDGNFSIKVNSPSTSLKISFVGYDDFVLVLNGQKNVDILLSAGMQLDEVVVTALGISRKKKAIGYAMTELKSDDINDAKETNVINQLAGRVAGINITKSSAGPGSGSRVIIRGNNSLSGNNQPLYVVDGVPVDNSGFGSANGAGTANYKRTDYGTGISDINPDDIASVSVLKGPNAAALYGSRAANGVILITTKKGARGKGLGVTYSTYYTMETPMILPKYQNEYGMGSLGQIDDDLETYKTHSGSWGPKMDGSERLYWTGDKKAYSAAPDNVKNFFRTGSNFINTLAFNGGNDFGTFRFSYTNTKANSILENSGLQRHNFNLRAGANLTDKLSLDAKVTYFIQNSKNRPDQGTEGIMAYLYGVPRNVSIDDLKDYQNDDYSSRSYNSLGSNPYWLLYNDRNDDRRNRMQGFTKLTYKFSEHFSIMGRIGLDNIDQNIETVNAYGHWYYPTGGINFRDYKTAESNMDFLAMYNTKLSSDLNFDFNFGGNMMRRTFSSQGISASDFRIPTKATVTSTNPDKRYPFYNPQGEKRINSLYVSSQFGYKNFAYLDLTGRNDWSSTLPESNRSYFYPSASLSFLLSELINVNAINYSKLRFSYAKVGSDTDPYKLTNSFFLDSEGYLGTTTLSTSSTRLNPNLKPEQTKSFEIGYETKMFDSRFYMDLTYYSIKTNDLITTVPVPPASGYSRELTNVGEMTNKGIEAVIGFVPVKTNDLTWDVSFNFAKNDNRLVKLIEGVDNFIFTTTNSGNLVVQATVDGTEIDGEKVEGHFGDIYGTELMRNDAGQLVVDATGHPQKTGKKVYLGNYQPDWTGGMFNVINYKNLAFKFLIDARIGGQLYSGTDARLDASGVSKRTLAGREDGIVVDGVVNTGTADEPVWEKNTVNIPIEEYFGSISGAASEYIYDQTNIRLREVSLTYKMPSSFFSKIGIKDVSIGLVGRNLMFFKNSLENFDPESTYSTSNFAQGVLFYNLPSTKSLGVNLRVKF